MNEEARDQPGRLDFGCFCGEVRGAVHSLTPRLGSRNSCCCASCQRFFEVLGCADRLDRYGGTEVLFLPMSRVTVDRGNGQLRCLDLSGRGLHRWYTACCSSPIGNCFAQRWPFFSVITTAVGSRSELDRLAGPSRGYVNLAHAREPVPRELRGSAPQAISRAILLLTRWRVRGWHQPSAFFDAAGTPISEPHRIDDHELHRRS